MSVTYFLLLFLCISLHACKARNLGTFDLKLEKKSDFFPKHDGENGFDDSTPKKLGLNNNGDKGMKAESFANIEKPKERKNMGKYDESFVPVYRGIPHKKLSEDNPKFTLDYSPPETHPPSHNS